jgi:hypothetical protein
MTKGAAIPQELDDALGKFSAESGRINDTIVNDLVSKRDLPPVIYHYTNDLGLRGILETGIFWLTDIFNLNDPSELRHGFSHAINALNNKAATGPPESKFFAKRFESFGRQRGIQDSAHYFVCSFSSCGDDLGQWRAYADNGRGYALGFDAKVLEDAFMKDGETQILNNSTYSITYNDSQLAEIQRQLIERMFHLISLPHGRALARDARNAYMCKLHVSLSVHALYPTLYFKHEAYTNEKEYRLLQIHPADRPPDVKFRSRPYSLVRYREFDWRTLAAKALKEIVIGPAAHKEKASQFVRDCFRAFQTDPVEPTYSGIPYRA